MRVHCASVAVLLTVMDLSSSGVDARSMTVKADGSIDWSQVTEITIVGAEDYHD